MQLTIEDLNEKYFYKTELSQLCRERKLPTYGTKAELTSYLTLYLKGASPKQVKPLRQYKPSSSRTKGITIDTKIISPEFKFSKETRSFFANYYHVETFNFNKQMATIKRRIETEHNTEYSVRDLITELKSNTQVFNTPEEQTYQWNKFVKDFNKDPNSTHFHSRMKVAAILWKKVRNSKSPKKYSKELIDQYFDQIKDL